MSLPDRISNERQCVPCQDMVQCASLMHRSLSLDLNMNEYTKWTPCVCTHEECIKSFQRPLPDVLGLDCDKRLEKVTERSFRKLPKGWTEYLGEFPSSTPMDVRTYIFQSYDKRRTFQASLRLLRRIQMLRSWNENLTDQYLLLFESFVRCLMKWTDTQLFVEFLQVLIDNPDFERHMFLSRSARCVEYVLNCARSVRFRLWVPTSKLLRGRTGKFLIRADFDNIRVLLMYGVSMENVAFDDTETSDWAPLNMPSYIINWNVNSKRKSRINQLLYFAKRALSNSNEAEEAADCFRLIWKSFPHAFLTTPEVHNHMHLSCRWVEALSVTRYLKAMLMVSRFYETRVAGCKVLKEPRSLMHLSRCVIRKQLYHNFQLPGGISRLELPTRLQEYLRLEE